MSEQYRTIDVPVADGALRVGMWGSPRSGGDVVMAAHGMTGNHACWWPLARALASVGDESMLVAPDLRGRGGSNTVGGPFGMAAHADDLMVVLDHVEAERAVLVGHSMGGFVACVAGTRHPDRVSSVVLVDGGAPLAIPDALVGKPAGEVLAAVTWPARQRLEMTFAARQAYHEFWRAHPAFAGEGTWTSDVERYVDYGLVGEPPEMRSGVSLEAVIADTQDAIVDPEATEAIGKLSCPATFVRAVRGMLNEEPPLYTEERVTEMAGGWPTVTRIVTVPDTNHYTVVLGDRGAAEIADLVHEVR